MRDVWTRSHLRGSSVRVREVIRGVGVELALSANMSNSTSTVRLVTRKIPVWHKLPEKDEQVLSLFQNIFHIF